MHRMPRNKLRATIFSVTPGASLKSATGCPTVTPVVVGGKMFLIFI